MDRRTVGIVGQGRVGGALARGLLRAGHEVLVVGRDRLQVRETVGRADVVILAVPYGALEAALAAVGGGIEGKPLVDVSNVIGPDRELVLGFSSSGAEELQKRARGARVVKAFNTVFAQYMETGRLGDQQLTAFVASDDAAAKREVLALAGDIGFDPVDAGPLRSARLLEPLGLLNMQLALKQGMGPDLGFKLLHHP